MSSPRKISRIDQTAVNDIKTIQTGDGGEMHQQIVSNVTIAEDSDAYPGFMQEKMQYLRKKMDGIREDRTVAMGVVGFAVVAGLTFGLAVPAGAFGVGAALLAKVATAILGAGGAIEGAIWGFSQSSLKRLAADEKEVFTELAGYHRARSLAMAKPAAPGFEDADISNKFSNAAGNAPPAAAPVQKAPSTVEFASLKEKGPA